MLIVALTSVIAVTLYALICTCYRHPVELFWIPIAFLVSLAVEYTGQDPVYLPAILANNGVFLFLAVAISWVATRTPGMRIFGHPLVLRHRSKHWLLKFTDFDVNPSGPHFWGVTMFLVIVALGIGVGVNSSRANDLAFDSLNTHVSESKKAPSMQRGVTQIAIPPKTVFYKTNHAFSSGVPHYNTLGYVYDNNDSDNGKREIQAQWYKKTPIFVVPIRYDGVFNYLRYRTVPGYFVIKATDPKASPHFVRKPIHYGPGMLFGHNIQRLIYRHDPMLKRINGAGPQLEINDHKTPFAVETLYRPNQFDTKPTFNNLRVAVANEQTGKVRFYKTSNAPKFVDENLTSSVAFDMNQYYGHYQRGIWNYWLFDAGVKDPTSHGPEDGVTTIFQPHHRMSYVTDFTSHNSNSSTTIGSSAINTRTGKFTYYHSGGIMDSGDALKYANETFSNYKGYKANNPVLYDIDGRATWIMSILDENHNQRYWLYADNNGSDHAHSASATAALDSFRQQLASDSGLNSNTHKMKKAIKTGTIDRFAIVNDRAVFTIKGHSKAYAVTISSKLKRALIHPGDKVRFKVGANGSHAASDLTDQSLD